MPIYNGKSHSSTQNLNLKGGARGTGVIRWTPPVSGVPALWASNPFGTTDYGLYINSTGKLVYSALGSSTVLGGGGGGGTPSWDDIFAADKTFNPNGTTWTIADGSASTNDILTITNAGTGAAIQVTNTSTGKDINGTGSTWSVTAAGVIAATQLTSPIVYSGANLILSAAGAGTITLGANANTITMAKATTFSSTVTVTDGLSTFISTANNAPAVLVTNNTVTTYGSGGADAGVVVIRSTSLTTGDLLKLQTDASVTSGQGNYLSCYDTGLSAEVFTISELGLTTIAGSAYATAVLALTLGDLSLADGRITHVAPSLTTGYGYSLTTVGLTTGTGMILAHTTSTIADGGSVLRISSTAANTGGATNGTLLDVKGTAQLAGTQVRVDSIQTTGTVMSVISTGIMTTTGNLLTLTGNAATTAAGLVRLNANDLTSGIGFVITSSATAMTGAGRLLYVNHTGATGDTDAILSEFASAATDETIILKVTASAANALGTALAVSSATTTGNGIVVTANSLTDGFGLQVKSSAAATLTSTGRLFVVTHSGNQTTSGVLAEVASAAADETVIMRVTASAALALGVALDISVAALTTGTALDIGGMAAITTGKGIVVAASGITRTDGILVSISDASTAATSTGRMLLVDHTGVTGDTGTILSEFKSAATDETVIMKVTASGANALGKALFVSTAVTTGNGIQVTANALTDGFGLTVDSSSTALTATGRLFLVNHSGATGTSAVIAEVKSAANDETVVFQVSNSSLLAGGKLVNLSAATMTTGTGLAMTNLDALTTGKGINVTSNSADASARSLVYIKNTNAAALLTVPLEIVNDTILAEGTTFKIGMVIGGITIYVCTDETTPDAALTGVKGDLCLNGPAGTIWYCDANGKNWTTL